ncbi:hypothetical protein A3C87_01475 [Candidatus Kaiserbacteria bacterium RIFCSPHIGHO2_02_FULL_49_34]|uniref:Phage shock protein PspC N-terminal domain-containing protein n=1 Tax=Candidatus Kaiserbacteria bacterium RIFCSPHIGHO2_02_FULL_49_34 TaxID=1798491 RepID=A0A1F6DIG4_9BACT|nr:MAG: hypothetical protein A3C87_01475 [Candidatus Kaiserbacteria bacterium RIFCSPHIGHO2_02_FULL_49_34]
MTEHHHVKKLYRETDDRMLAGVLSGMAKYLGIDATVTRVLFAFATVMTGVFPLAALYIISAFLIPTRTAQVTYDENGKRIY